MNADVMRLKTLKRMAGEQQGHEKQASVKTGVLIAVTLFGAWIGNAQAGRVSDYSTQSRWIAQGAFWGALIFAAFGTVVSCLLCRFRIRLAFALELIVVAALVSMFLSNLLYWNRISHERSLRMQKLIEQVEATQR